MASFLVPCGVMEPEKVSPTGQFGEDSFRASAGIHLFLEIVTFHGLLFSCAQSPALPDGSS
jgi:hypothetical protein